MKASAWITMIVVMAFVWGGFIAAIVTAMRKEADKTDE